MLELNVRAYTTAMVCLGHTEQVFRLYEQLDDRASLSDKEESQVIEKAKLFADACRLLPISKNLNQQLDRFIAKLEQVTLKHRTHRTLVFGQILEIKDNLINELDDHLYLAFAAESKVMWAEPEKWFGAGVVSAIPEVVPDVRDCVTCLCLEQWTASVYHAMGVVQHGIHWLASELHLVFERGIEVENWKNIIDQIEKAIRAQEQQPKTPARDEQLRFYSDLAHHFFYIKEAWRNHVMHVRRRYDEREARIVADHVRQIMSAIAEKIWLAASAPQPQGDSDNGD